MPGTNLSSTKTSLVKVVLTDDSDNAIFVVATTTPSATAGYAIGCILIDATEGELYINTATATSCTFEIR